MLWQFPSISIAPDIIFNIFGFPVTNTLLCTWISGFFLILLFFFGVRRQQLIPSRFQGAIEALIEFLLGLVTAVVGNDREKGKKFFPLVASFFLFILVANLLDVIPGVDTVGTIDTAAVARAHAQPVFGFLLFNPISSALIPWIRPATTDLNLNIAMALIAVVTAQFFGFASIGAKQHLSKYFNFKGPIDFFVGILELVGEFTRIISLAFRLFGNIFAGSVVLAAFAFLLPALADIIFIPFEIFVAGVQALIFALLTLIYLQLATESHEHAEEEYKEHASEEREAQPVGAAH